jgi:hypothetical protein
MLHSQLLRQPGNTYTQPQKQPFESGWQVLPMSGARE